MRGQSQGQNRRFVKSQAYKKAFGGWITALCTFACSKSELFHISLFSYFNCDHRTVVLYLSRQVEYARGAIGFTRHSG
jgi:hypothetical protein